MIKMARISNLAVSETLINSFSKCACDLFLARGYSFVTFWQESVLVLC